MRPAAALGGSGVNEPVEDKADDAGGDRHIGDVEDVPIIAGIVEGEEIGHRAPSRNAHSAELKAELAKRLAPLSAVELESQLMKAGCPAGLVRTSLEAVRMPGLGARGMLPQTTAEAGRTVTLMNAGFVADAADGPALSGPVPALGADTDAVLGELGYGPAEIEGLRAEGAV